MKPKDIVVMLFVLTAIVGIAFTIIENRVRASQALVPEVEIDWGAVVDDPSRKIELHWLGNHYFPQARDETWIENMLEDHFNVELQGLFMDERAYLRRKPLAFMSGSVPDVIWEFSPDILRRDAYHGFLLELPYEVIQEHAPTYVEQLNRIAPEGWLQTYWEGGNYGIPLYMVAGQYPRPGMWRMDWLRNVGIQKVPETLDETYEALWKFRHEDPDGNGTKDTYGESPFRMGMYTFSKIFAAYGVLPYDWVIRNGEVIWGGTLPECKEVLAILRKWYADELIDPDFLTSPEGSAKRISVNKFISGRVGYLALQGSWIQVSTEIKNSLSFYYQMEDQFPGLELVPGRYPLGPEGLYGDRADGAVSSSAIAFGRHLEKEPWKVIRMLKIFEELAVNAKLHVQAITGKEGEHWEYQDDVGIVIRPKYVEARKKQLITRIDFANGYYAPFSVTPEVMLNYLAEDEIRHLEIYQNPKYALPRAFASPLVVPSAREYWADLRRLQEAAFYDIIRGNKEVDSFDDFVEEWYARGGREFLADAREYYQVRNHIFEQLGIEEN